MDMSMSITFNYVEQRGVSLFHAKRLLMEFFGVQHWMTISQLVRNTRDNQIIAFIESGPPVISWLLLAAIHDSNIRKLNEIKLSNFPILIVFFFFIEHLFIKLQHFTPYQLMLWTQAQNVE